MATEELVKVHPMELRFPLREGFESKCSVQLTNLTPHAVAFKVETTSDNDEDTYTVRQTEGVFSAGSTFEIEIVANKAPWKLISCSPRLKIRCVVLGYLSDGMTFSDMFFAGKAVQEVKLPAMLLF